MWFAIWCLLTFWLMTTDGEKRAATFIATHMCQMSHIDFNPQPFARMQIRFQFRKLLLRPILWRDDIFIAVQRRFMENGTHTTVYVPRIRKMKTLKQFVYTRWFLIYIKTYHLVHIECTLCPAYFPLKWFHELWQTIIISIKKMLQCEQMIKLISS